MPVQVSVCMATYNGERYVGEQLRSILDELEAHDEVIIVDDASTDSTIAVLDAVEDPRVRVIAQAQNRGYVRTFAHAMELAVGDVLMLADQDDVWVPGRRRALVDALRDRQAAASNLVLLGDDAPLRSPVTGKPWRLRTATSRQRIRNELRILSGAAPYFGCAMAVRRDFLSSLMPFPEYLVESHDLWIATVANTFGELQHVDRATVRRRIHELNASSPRPRGVSAALRSRWMLARLAAEALRRRRRAAKRA
ncbi:MAG TPA: glycosyltransferase [Microbacteriaceae bacterium]|nr:glycosyltransferase [Actinomycetota bacterium]HOA86156.1 glycosyltransferase [Microbacteriaceae bacterium]HQA22697.1 glycosyltransferase [Rhodoglobus sp.]HQE45821.1 glycosyltransferase [Rhodoglobus sp.]